MKVPNNSLSAMRVFFDKELADVYNRNELQIIWEALCKVFVPHIKPGDDKISESEILKFLYGIKKLKKLCPYQYVSGYADFYNLKIGVNENTLIPRPETEELVDWILKSESDEILTVKDICTGSGCIALALASKRKMWKMKATDYYTKTLHKAKMNAKELGIDILVEHEDALAENFNDAELWDIIVSNPPYITQSEKSEMHASVLDFEPHAALFAGGEDPLIFYRKIAENALRNLKSGGRLYFELNQYFAKEIKDIVENLGFEKVEIKIDMSGNSRMLRAYKKQKLTG